MDEESNIKRAQPKQGLQTGGLEGAKGGLSAKQQIARNYEDALSGAKGPDARFDAIESLVQSRVQEAINNITFSSPGGTQIFGLNGRFAITSTGRRGRGGARREDATVPTPLTPWAFASIDAGTPAVVLNPGTILKGSDQIDAVLTCSNPTASLTVGVDRYLAIKITAEEPTSFELVSLSSWPETDGYQVSFTGTVGAGTFVFTSRHYPLWTFVGTATSETIPITSGIHALRLAPRASLQIQYGPYRTPAGEYPHLPEFVASHHAP